MKIEALFAIKENGTVNLFNEDMEFKGAIPPEQKQPNSRTKTIELNCCTWVLQWLPKMAIYDNEGKSLDRYTILFLDRKEQDILGTRKLTYAAIGASETGAGVYLHTYAQKGNYLGKTVTFKSLDHGLRKLLKEE